LTMRCAARPARHAKFAITTRLSSGIVPSRMFCVRDAIYVGSSYLPGMPATARRRNSYARLP
jgi:hypothetical protein